MALKPITRQEQIIAGKNLEPITRMERFLKEYGGGSSGSVQSDWNQTDSSAADFIKNKPFEESYGDTLTIEAIDLDTFDPSTLVGEMFLKVCDTVVTMDDLSNGYVFQLLNEVAEVPPEAVGETAMQIADGICTFGEVFISIEEQGVGVELDGMVFPESGLYMMAELLLEVGGSLTIPGFGKFWGIQTLATKYVPNIPASKLPANAINVQPDWNQSDETAMDFIKNKPNNDPVILGFEKENEVRYLTYEGKRITAAELSELVGYRVALVSVYNAPVLSIIGTNSGSIVTTMEVDAYLNVTYVHYRTAEYTPTT